MSTELSSPRVRIAPSPTGFLHIGTARTALFNLLYARKQKGTFLLRIEDTDTERSKKEFEQDILDGFAWLGITFDEGVMPDGSEKGAFGPYRQSARIKNYKPYLEQLLEKREAYYCFCSKEKLDEDRKADEAKGKAPIYSGTCSAIELEEAKTRVEKGERAVIRIRVPNKTISFRDEIRGELSFEGALLGDLVIAKSLDEPLYNFVVVIDDYEMKISHVIRGDDHLSNTFKQVVIGEALGLKVPIFAHLPVILSPAGKGKMSKREGGAAIREYRAEGYLPEAIINFLALIGWHPTDDRELFSLGELIEEFSLERVQKSGAAFNREKLDYFNAAYIKKLPEEVLVARLAADEWSEKDWGRDSEKFKKTVLLVRDRLTTLGDFKKEARFLFELPSYEAELLQWKGAAKEVTKARLETLLAILEHHNGEEEFRKAIEDEAVKQGKGEIYWPLRVALSGQKSSPPPIDLIGCLGREVSRERLKSAILKLS